MQFLIIGAIIGIVLTILISEYLNRQQTPEQRAQKDIENRRKQYMEAYKKAEKIQIPQSTKDEMVLGYISATDIHPRPPDNFFRITMQKLGNSLLIGESGKGKTETAKRICAWTAKYTDWRIIFIDGKGEQQTQKEFIALMIEAGRDPEKMLAFPLTPINGFKGDGDSIFARLKHIFQDTTKGSANRYYSDIGEAAVSAIVPTSDIAPKTKEDKRLRTREDIENLRTIKSSEELLRRLNNIRVIQQNVKGTNSEKAIGKISGEDLIGIQLTMKNFFNESKGCFDGKKGFEDIDCAYLMLEGTADQSAARQIAQYLTADFIDFITSPARKKDNRRTLFIFDEISAVPEIPVLNMYERLRSKGANVIIAGQSFNRLARTDDERKGLLSAKNSVLLHKIDDPETFTKLAGAEIDIVRVTQEKEGKATGVESIKKDKKFKVNPDEVRELQVGELFFIKDGRYARVKVIPSVTSKETNRKTEELFKRWEEEAQARVIPNIDLDQVLSEFKDPEKPREETTSKDNIAEPPKAKREYEPTEEEIQECINSFTPREKETFRDAGTTRLKERIAVEGLKLAPDERSRMGHAEGVKAIREAAIKRLKINHKSGFEDVFAE